MDTEWIPNRNGADKERLRIIKMKKSVLQNANYKRMCSSEHMIVSYSVQLVSYLVLTKDLEMLSL